MAFISVPALAQPSGSGESSTEHVLYPPLYVHHHRTGATELTNWPESHRRPTGATYHHEHDHPEGLLDCCIDPQLLEHPNDESAKNHRLAEATYNHEHPPNLLEQPRPVVHDESAVPAHSLDGSLIAQQISATEKRKLDPCVSTLLFYNPLEWIFLGSLYSYMRHPCHREFEDSAIVYVPVDQRPMYVSNCLSKGSAVAWGSLLDDGSHRMGPLCITIENEHAVGVSPDLLNSYREKHTCWRYVSTSEVQMGCSPCKKKGANFQVSALWKGVQY